MNAMMEMEKINISALRHDPKIDNATKVFFHDFIVRFAVRFSPKLSRRLTLPLVHLFCSLLSVCRRAASLVPANRDSSALYFGSSRNCQSGSDPAMSLTPFAPFGPDVFEEECGDEESEENSNDTIADVIEIGIGRVAKEATSRE